MTTISLEEMQRDLLCYLWQVEQGETVIITRAGQPVAEIRPAARPESDDTPLRKPRRMKSAARSVSPLASSPSRTTLMTHSPRRFCACLKAARNEAAAGHAHLPLVRQ
jgi:antitoxin (DNA-binding transcriptional repressor) of toxin-antitoxin stability system